MYRYRNTTDSDLMVPGIGFVASGETIASEVELESFKLEKLTEEAPKPQLPPPPPAAPALPASNTEVK